jgi:uncharacterized protein
MDAYDNDELEIAARLMEECAEQGDPVARFTMALWNRDGDGVPINLERSKHWLVLFEELAEQGNLEAQWELCQHYRFGNLFELNIERANYWLERAAEADYGEAQHHLAWYFESGQYGYPIDPQAAASWYQRAFEQECPETLYLFAMRQFLNGKPTEAALDLLRKAADKGFKQAAHVLHDVTH